MIAQSVSSHPTETVVSCLEISLQHDILITGCTPYGTMMSLYRTAKLIGNPDYSASSTRANIWQPRRHVHVQLRQ
ncbi:hypothetical protein C8Q77DRAFT_328666 [Trametes polyzona]|nr:hypothetical protein C8Q77DRAFT_328666 [Trametes polyzona]